MNHGLDTPMLEIRLGIPDKRRAQITRPQLISLFSDGVFYAAFHRCHILSNEMLNSDFPAVLESYKSVVGQTEMKRDKRVKCTGISIYWAHIVVMTPNPLVELLTLNNKRAEKRE